LIPVQNFCIRYFLAKDFKNANDRNLQHRKSSIACAFSLMNSFTSDLSLKQSKSYLQLQQSRFNGCNKHDNLLLLLWNCFQMHYEKKEKCKSMRPSSNYVTFLYWGFCNKDDTLTNLRTRKYKIGRSLANVWCHFWMTFLPVVLHLMDFVPKTWAHFPEFISTLQVIVVLPKS